MLNSIFSSLRDVSSEADEEEEEEIVVVPAQLAYTRPPRSDEGKVRSDLNKFNPLNSIGLTYKYPISFMSQPCLIS